MIETNIKQKLSLISVFVFLFSLSLSVANATTPNYQRPLTISGINEGAPIKLNVFLENASGVILNDSWFTTKIDEKDYNIEKIIVSDIKNINSGDSEIVKRIIAHHLHSIWMLDLDGYNKVPHLYGEDNTISFGNNTYKISFLPEDETIEGLNDYERRVALWSNILLETLIPLKLKIEAAISSTELKDDIDAELSSYGYTSDDTLDNLINFFKEEKNCDIKKEVWGTIGPFSPLVGQLKTVIKDNKLIDISFMDEELRSMVGEVGGFLEVAGFATNLYSLWDNFKNLNNKLETQKVINSLFSILLHHNQTKKLIEFLKDNVSISDPAFIEALSIIENSITSDDALIYELASWTEQINDQVFNQGLDFTDSLIAVATSAGGYALGYLGKIGKIALNAKAWSGYASSAGLLIYGANLSYKTVSAAWDWHSGIEDWVTARVLSNIMINKLVDLRFDAFKEIQPDASNTAFLKVKRFEYFINAIGFNDLNTGIALLEPENKTWLTGTAKGLVIGYNFLFGSLDDIDTKRDEFYAWAQPLKNEYATKAIFEIEKDYYIEKIVPLISIETPSAGIGASANIVTNGEMEVNSSIFFDAVILYSNCPTIAQYEWQLLKPTQSSAQIETDANTSILTPDVPGNYAVIFRIKCGEEILSEIQKEIYVLPESFDGHNIELNTVSSISKTIKPGTDLTIDLTVRNTGFYKEDVYAVLTINGPNFSYASGEAYLGSIEGGGHTSFFNNAIEYEFPENLSEGGYKTTITIRAGKGEEDYDDNIKSFSSRYGKKEKVVENIYEYETFILDYHSSWTFLKRNFSGHNYGGFGTAKVTFTYKGQSYWYNVYLHPESGDKYAYVAVEGSDGYQYNRKKQYPGQAFFYDGRRLVVIAEEFFRNKSNPNKDKYEIKVGFPVGAEAINIEPAEIDALVGDQIVFNANLGEKGRCCVNRDFFEYNPDTSYNSFDTDKKYGYSDNSLTNKLDIDATIKDHGYIIEVTPMVAGTMNFVVDMGSASGKDYFVIGKINSKERPVDSDNDGFIDENDAFINDPAASVDTDGDLYPDAWNEGKSESDSTTGLKLDFDPLDPNAFIDSDGDKIHDGLDLFPHNPFEAFDSDGDLVGDNQDECPNDPNETKDFDGDNIGDNADEDDDNDLIPDVVEIENGLDPYLSSDADEDFDNDTFSNRKEIESGTDLWDENSYPSQGQWVEISEQLFLDQTAGIFDRINRVIYSNLIIINNTETFETPLRIVLNDSSLQLASTPDGYMETGEPYWEIGLDSAIYPGDERQLRFDFQAARVQLSYNISIYQYK